MFTGLAQNCKISGNLWQMRSQARSKRNEVVCIMLQPRQALVWPDSKATAVCLAWMEHSGSDLAP